MSKDKVIYALIGLNMVFLIICILLWRKPPIVIEKTDRTLDLYLMDKNIELERENAERQLKIEIYESQIKKDSATVWSAGRIKRDSIRAIYNPR